jgi:hypothetical protein
MACLLGNSGEIFFPKLHEDQMVNFKDIAFDFLRNNGFEPLVCGTEEEAKLSMPSALLDKKYPILLFNSDTSGEKLYEEFYTEKEQLDLTRFDSLGVIKNAARRDKATLNSTIDEIKSLFEKNVEKKDVVTLLNNLLPGFQHIETGTNLDQKM